MRQFILGCGTALFVSTAVLAQSTLPVPPPQDTAPAQVGPQTLYARTDANIRAGAGKDYNVIGKLAAGQPFQVTGPALDNPDWLQVASGGFVAQAVTSPTPVAAVVHHTHRRSTGEPTAADNYPVGSCQPYTRVINIAGQAPQQGNGTACKGPDGAWRIQGNGQAVAVPPPQPVVVQGPPVYAAPPVYAQPVPVYPQPVPVYPQPIYR